MSALVLRSIELALHWVLLGGLSSVGFQLHQGRHADALLATATAAVSILALAVAYKVARRIMRR